MLRALGHNPSEEEVKELMEVNLKKINQMLFTGSGRKATILSALSPPNIWREIK